MWVRGLKQIELSAVDNEGLSHPVWVCGLKHQLPISPQSPEGRTPPPLVALSSPERTEQ